MDGTVVKTTVLEGFYATGDHESFCFDRHSGPADHDADLDARFPCEDVSVVPPNGSGATAWKAYFDSPAYHAKTAIEDARQDAGEACRVYPDALLPDVPPETRYGRWTIRVEFTPLPEPV